MAFEKKKEAVFKTEDLLPENCENYAEFNGKDGRQYVFFLTREKRFLKDVREGKTFTWVAGARDNYSDFKKTGEEEHRLRLFDYKDRDGRLFTEDFKRDNVIFLLGLSKGTGKDADFIYIEEEPLIKDKFLVEGRDINMDNGVMGFAYAGKRDLKDKYGWDGIGKAELETLCNVLQEEVDEVNAFNCWDNFRFGVMDFQSEEVKFSSLISASGGRLRDFAKGSVEGYLEDKNVQERLFDKVLGADERIAKPLSCYKVAKNLKEVEADFNSEIMKRKTFYPGKKEGEYWDVKYGGLTKIRTFENDKEGNEIFVLYRENDRRDDSKNEYFYIKGDFSEKSACEFLRQYDREMKSRELENTEENKNGIKRGR